MKYPKNLRVVYVANPNLPMNTVLCTSHIAELEDFNILADFINTFSEVQWCGQTLIDAITESKSGTGYATKRDSNLIITEI